MELSPSIRLKSVKASTAKDTKVHEGSQSNSIPSCAFVSSVVNGFSHSRRAARCYLPDLLGFAAALTPSTAFCKSSTEEGVNS